MFVDSGHFFLASNFGILRRGDFFALLRVKIPCMFKLFGKKAVCGFRENV